MIANNKSIDMTEGPIAGRLMQFFFPILFGMLLQQLYNTVDAIVIGKYEGTYALGAVGGATAVLINLIVGFVVGLASGSSVVISQLFGSKDERRMGMTVHTVISFYFLAGIFLTVFGYLITPWALTKMNTPPEILPLAVIYMRIYFLGAIPLLIYNIASGILRAVGDSRHPLYFLIVCFFLNIGLNLLFVAVLHMGVAGVALGTVLSQLASAVMSMWVLIRSRDSFRFEFRRIGIDWPSLTRTLQIGLPSGIQSSMYSVSNMIIQAAVNGLGATVVAGWTAEGKLGGAFWVSTNAFNIAVCAFSGQCFGAGKYERLKKSLKVGLFLNCGIALFLSAALLGFGRQLLHLFSDDPEVIETAYHVAWITMPFYVCYAVIDVLSGILRGVGETFKPTVIVIIGICLVRILWISFVVPVWNSLDGITWSYPVSWVLSLTAMIVLYTRSRWLEHAKAHVRD